MERKKCNCKNKEFCKRRTESLNNELHSLIDEIKSHTALIKINNSKIYESESDEDAHSILAKAFKREKAI